MKSSGAILNPQGEGAGSSGWGLVRSATDPELLSRGFPNAATDPRERGAASPPRGRRETKPAVL